MGRLMLLFQLESQQAAFEPVKVDGEFADCVDGNQESAEAENRTGLVLRMIAGKKGADMAEFIKIDNVMHVPSTLAWCQRRSLAENTKARSNCLHAGFGRWACEISHALKAV